MEVDQQYNVNDIIKYAYENQPSKVQDVFNELMSGRIYDSIMQKKVEVAQQFFNQDRVGDDMEEAPTEEDIEDGQDSE
jgi:hypothetical protein